MAATPPVAYLTGTEDITPAPMNALWSSFDARLERLLGGRSFILAFNLSTMAQVPAHLFGQTFFFTDGPTAYAQKISGYIAKNFTVPDPVNGGTVVGVGAQAYDHSVFTAAASAAIVSLDPVNGVPVAHIADIPGGSYPAGYTKKHGTSLLENSLEAHTRNVGGVDYFIYENDTGNPFLGGGVYPTKIYNYALADIIIEGVTSVSIPSSWNKFKCFRFHNLQRVDCAVTVHGVSFTLQPFECRSFRSGYSLAAGAYRYFFKFQNDDPRCFWYFASVPSKTADSVKVDYAQVSTAGMQGNNLSNPCVLFDFIQALSWTHGTSLLAYFQKDLHELCDLQALIPDYATKYGAANSNATRLGDMIHHRGTLDIARVAIDGRTDPASGVPLCTFDTVEFRGYATLAADLAAKGIKVTTHANGNLVLQRDPAGADVGVNAVAVLGTGTNLLKRFSQDNGTSVDDYLHADAPVGYNIDAPRQLDQSYCMEVLGVYSVAGGQSGTPNAAAQNAHGDRTFVLRRQSGYKIYQRNVLNTARTATYRALTGGTVTVTGAPARTIVLATAAAQTPVTSMHLLTLGRLKLLDYFGATGRASQDDAHVQYLNPQFILTPEGLVLTFTESVRADIATWQLGTTWYGYPQHPSGAPGGETVTAETRYQFNSTTGRLEAQHVVRFRKHGFGWSQWGKGYAGFYSPIIGRCIVAGYQHEVIGPAGADFGFPDQQARETGIKAIRQFVPELLLRVNLLKTGAGGRFFQANKLSNIDLLVHYDQVCRGSSLWYWALVGSLATRDPGTAGVPVNLTTQRFPTALPLCAEHFNAFAQAVNQLKTGRVLDWQALRFVVGNRIRELRLPAGEQDNSTGLTRWDSAIGFGSLPAPIDAMLRITNDAAPLADWTWIFGQLGIPIQTGDSRLATQFAEFYNGFNQTRNVVETGLATVAATYTGYFIADPNVAVANDEVYIAQWNCAVTISLSCALTAPVNSGAAGTAFLPPATVGAVLTSINLQTAYSTIKWIKTGDFKTWCASAGFPFKEVDVFVPLTLDWCELPTEFADAPFQTSNPVQTTNVPYEAQVGSALQPNPDLAGNARNTMLAITNTLNATQRTFTHTSAIDGTPGIASGGPSYSKLMAFRLANTTLEYFFKVRLPLAGGLKAPPEIRNLSSQRSMGETPRWLWHRLCGFKLGSDGGLTLDEIYLGNNFLTPQAPAATHYGTIPPWLPLGYHTVLTNASVTPPFTRRVEHLGTNAATAPYYYLRFKKPTDAEQLRRAENLYALYEGENWWIACRLTASAGLELSQDLHLLPAPQFAREKDTWLSNYDNALANMLVGYGYVHPLDGSHRPQTGTIPIRDLALPAPAKVTATPEGTDPAAPGLTLLKPNPDEVFTVLYDPAGLKVAL